MSIIGGRNVLGKVLSKARAMADDVATDELMRRGKRMDLGVPEPVGQDKAFLHALDDETFDTMSERTWSINHDRFEAPDDVLNVIRATGEVADDPSRVITHAETKVAAGEVARRNGLNPKALQKLAGEQGWQTANLAGAEQILVDSATQVRDATTVLQAKRAAGTATDSDVLGFRQLFARHTAVAQTFSGMTSEAGRQLNILKSMKSSGQLYKGQTADNLSMMGGKEFSLDILDMITDMDDPAALNKLAISLAQPGAKDMTHELWMNGMLSAFRTQEVNFLGNVLARGFENMEQVWAGAIGDSVNLARRLSGKDTTMHASLTDTAPLMYGEIKGFFDGMKIFGKTFTAGESSFDKFTKLELDGAARRQPAVTTANIANLFGKRAPEGTFAKALDFFFDYSPVAGRLPTRFMAATDDFFKSISYRGTAEMTAKRMARDEAIQIGKQGDSGWVANRSQELMRDMPEELHLTAMEDAQRSTFTSPLNSGVWGQLGGLAGAFRKVDLHVGFGRFIVPFARTPINIFKWAAQRTPLGIIDGEVIAAIKAGGVKSDEAIARIAAGSTMMTAGVLLYDMGLMSGPGPGKDGREISKTLRRQEFTPRSLILPGEMFADGKRRTVDISRADPVGMLLGAAADVKDVMFWADDMETREQIAMDVGVATSRAMKDKTFLTGMSNFIVAMEDPDRKMGVWLDRLGGSFVPTILSDINRDLVDETAREVNSVLDAWCSRLPGCSDSLPPKRQLWGDKITYEDFNMFSPLQVSVDQDRDTDPLDMELVANRIQIKDLPRTWKGVDLRSIRLEDESGEQRSAYERWQELAGRGIKSPVTGLNLVESLNALLKDPNYLAGTDGPDGEKALDIKAEFAQYRSMALEQIVVEFPELRQKFLDIKAREAQQQMTPDSGDMELQLIESLDVNKTPLF